MRTHTRLAPLLGFVAAVTFGLALPASAQTSRARGDRALALSEATQTVNRFFTCVAEGVNAGADAERTERATQCFQENYDENGLLLFNGLELPGIGALLDTFTGDGLGAQQFENTSFNVDTVIDRDYTPRRLRDPARIELRVNVLTTFLNEVPQSPALPLPLGEFAAAFIEEFTLEEQRPGLWVIVRITADPLSAVQLPDGSILTPFPATPSVLRSR